MRIGVYANVCGDNLGRLIGYCQGIGVREVGLPCRMVPGFEERGYLEVKSLDEIKRKLEDGGLKVGMADFFPRKEEEKDAERLSRTIAALGDVRIDTFNFFVTDRVPEGESKRQAGWGRIVGLYERMVKEAEKAEVRIGTHIYPERGRFVHNCEMLRRLLTEVESEYNGVTMCLGSCYQTGDDLYEDIRLFGRKICFVHARQVKEPREKSGDLRLDEGDIDLRRAMQELRKAGFIGMICPEHLPHVAGEEHAEISQALAVGYLRGITEGLR